jgi:hypothetical protein
VPPLQPSLLDGSVEPEGLTKPSFKKNFNCSLSDKRQSFSAKTIDENIHGPE